jgi:hypothetical protein
LAVLPHHSLDNFLLEEQNRPIVTGSSKVNKKNMVVLYDDGDNSDEILHVTKCFANMNIFNLNVVAINRKDLDNNEIDTPKSNFSNKQAESSISSEYIKRKEYFLKAGVQFNEIRVPGDIEKDNIQFGKLILKSIVEFNPDIVITESTIGKKSLLAKSSFADLLMYRLNCPIIVVKDFSIPFVNVITRTLMKIKGNLGPTHLIRLMQNKKE